MDLIASDVISFHNFNGWITDLSNNNIDMWKIPETCVIDGGFPRFPKIIVSSKRWGIPCRWFTVYKLSISKHLCRSQFHSQVQILCELKRSHIFQLSNKKLWKITISIGKSTINKPWLQQICYFFGYCISPVFVVNFTAFLAKSMDRNQKPCGLDRSYMSMFESQIQMCIIYYYLYILLLIYTTITTTTTTTTTTNNNNNNNYYYY